MTYSHIGWFGFCPVYIANPHGPCPELTPRKPWLMWLMHLNVALQQATISVCSMMDSSWEPTWKIRLSGKLVTPVRC